VLGQPTIRKIQKAWIVDSQNAQNFASLALPLFFDVTLKEMRWVTLGTIAQYDDTNLALIGFKE
jgi:hypothetical protein